MKVRKKNKIGSFVLAVIIFTMIASTAIGVYTVEQYNKNFENVAPETEAGLSSLQSTLNKLLSTLNGLNNTLNKMDGTDMNVNDWKEASANLQAKLDELDKAEADFFAAYTDDDRGLTFKDYFQYHFNGVSSTDIFFELKDDAILKMNRAKSLEELNKILADYKKAIDDVPTKMEKIYSLISEIEKKGVDLTDFDNYIMLTHIFDYTHEALFAYDSETGYDEHKELTEKMEEFYKSFKSVSVDAFLAKMANLPKDARLISLDNAKAVSEARLAYDTIINKGFYTRTELIEMNIKKLTNALNLLPQAEAQISILNLMKGEVDAKGNPKVEGANAAWINSLIAKHKKDTVSYDLKTKEWLNQILALVKEFDSKNWELEGSTYTYNLVTSKKSEFFVQKNYDLIDRATLATYVEKYDKASENARYDANYFIKKVNEVKVVTFDMKQQLDYMLGWYEELLVINKTNVTAEQVDYLLDFDKENGIVAAYEKYKTLVEDWNLIVKYIADIEEFAMSKDIRETINGKEYIILHKLLKLDLAPVKEKVNHLLETGHKLEDIINEEALKEYNYIMTYCNAYYDAIDRVEAAYGNSESEKRDAIKAELLETIEKGRSMPESQAIPHWNNLTDEVIKAEFDK